MGAPVDVEIKRIGSADTGLFSRVAPDVFDAPINPARLAAYLSDPNHVLLLALVDGEVIGQCAAVIHRHPDKATELYIDEVGVTPSRQRQGVARRMLDEIFALGRSFGCEECWVGTEADNIQARGLYENRGASAEPFIMYAYKL